jgi:hypothetical protein
VAVGQGGGERVFGCQPEVDGDHHNADLGGDLRRGGVCGVEIPDDEPAAVQVEQTGQ